MASTLGCCLVSPNDAGSLDLKPLLNGMVTSDTRESMDNPRLFSLLRWHNGGELLWQWTFYIGLVNSQSIFNHGGPDRHHMKIDCFSQMAFMSSSRGLCRDNLGAW
jgi:hypothetical protein